MAIKAVIHDWDDTITNSFESYTQFYFDFGDFHKLGNPDLEKIRKHWGGTISEIVSGVWPGLSPEEAEEKTGVFIETVKLSRKTYTAKVFPQVKETILELDRLGVKLGIISSGDSKQIKRIYKEQINKTLRPYCFMYDHKELGYRKPDARIFDKPFKKLMKLNIGEKDTIYVGDSFQDYLTAKNRGLKFYAVTTGLKTRNDFIKEGLNPKYVLPDFNAVLKLFR